MAGLPQPGQPPSGGQQPLNTQTAAPGGQQSAPAPPQQQAGESSGPTQSLMLCRLGLETVQDLVSRTIELHTLLKAAQLPGPASTAPPEQMTRIRDNIAKTRNLFKRLGVCYQRVAEDTQALDLTPVESLIPYEDEGETKPPLGAATEASRRLKEETAAVRQQLAAASQRQQQTIQQLRQLVWDGNTLLASRAGERRG